jgi:DNA-directed RNA polymerase subunit RPC12/RpoP
LQTSFPHGILAGVSESDILFECPDCGKSLVIDQAATGRVIDCPQCHTAVIVPERLSETERLLLAAEQGDEEAVEYALANGAQVAATTPDGHTALELAKRGGHVRIMRMLWQAGAK